MLGDPVAAVYLAQARAYADAAEVEKVDDMIAKAIDLKPWRGEREALDLDPLDAHILAVVHQRMVRRAKRRPPPRARQRYFAMLNW